MLQAPVISIANSTSGSEWLKPITAMNTPVATANSRTALGPQFVAQVRYLQSAQNCADARSAEQQAVGSGVTVKLDLGNQRRERTEWCGAEPEHEGAQQHTANLRRMKGIARARDNRPVNPLGPQPRRHVAALPQEKREQQRQAAQIDARATRRTVGSASARGTRITKTTNEVRSETCVANTAGW